LPTSYLCVVARPQSFPPTTVNRTVTPRRLPNSELRTREYLTVAEVTRLMEAAKHNRYGRRDATMILLG
jgi:type 1 fimbriae regulatory protein FimB/type 1 fimbriae regulatory protein FimE